MSWNRDIVQHGAVRHTPEQYKMQSNTPVGKRENQNLYQIHKRENFPHCRQQIQSGQKEKGRFPAGTGPPETLQATGRASTGQALRWPQPHLARRSGHRRQHRSPALRQASRPGVVRLAPNAPCARQEVSPAGRYAPLRFSECHRPPPSLHVGNKGKYTIVVRKRRALVAYNGEPPAARHAGGGGVLPPYGRHPLGRCVVT